MSIKDTFYMADEGGLRNEEKLTNAQKIEIEAYALSLKMPIDKIYFSDYQETVYADGDDYVVFGRDVLPVSGKSDNPNNNVSWKGAVAHEIVGHREAKLKGHTLPDRVLEDVQASIRAAKFAPGLTNAERVMLVRDAVFRLSKRGRSLRKIKHLLHIKER